ncbi:MAG: acyl-CoA dehydrogenase family protein [Chloroflexota bacterium]
MEFGWSPEEEAFRQEVRGFIRNILPRDWDDRYQDEWEQIEGEGSEDMRRALWDKKWHVMAWPVEYGGLAFNHWRQLVVNEEVAYHRLGLGDIGGGIVGPSMMLFGDERQKQQFLPAIAKGTLRFCQLFTEPGSGSDLASLQTKAVRDGDHYLVSGQKIFTSGAHKADWGWLGARTDPDAPKHRGISTFVIDMHSPGVTVRPLINITGVHSQNEVFFDEVVVPAQNLVGEENRGWYQMAATLDFERSNAARFAGAKRYLEDMVRLAATTKHNGRLLGKQPRVRSKLAEMAIQIDVGRFLGYRTVYMQTQGLIPNKEASAVKVFGGELDQRLANVAVNMMGLYGQLKRGSKFAPLHGRVEGFYLNSVFHTIGQGTSEVNRNIIATRGLGLPR